MIVEMKVSDVLDKAGELIERDGHCKGANTKGKKHCAVGAILEIDSNSYAAALEEMKNEIRHDWVAGWNDDPKRKKSQVVRAFRQAAEKARAEGR